MFFEERFRCCSHVIVAVRNACHNWNALEILKLDIAVSCDSVIISEPDDKWGRLQLERAYSAFGEGIDIVRAVAKTKVNRYIESPIVQGFNWICAHKFREGHFDSLPFLAVVSAQLKQDVV